MYDEKKIMVTLEVTIEVDSMDADVKDKLLIEVRKMNIFSHLFVVQDSEAEEETDFNNEVTSLIFNVIIATRLVISAMNVDQLLR